MTILQSLRHACGLDERRCAACHMPYDEPASTLASTLGNALDSPPLCPDCRAAVRCARPLCARCGAPLPPSRLDGGLDGGRERDVCATCGKDVCATFRKDVCASCLAAPPPWVRLHTVGPYEGALRDLLLRAKYRADRSACRVLGLLLAEKLLAEKPKACPPGFGAGGPGGCGPELVLPMPLHPARLRRRGFNQCQEIAQPVSRLLGLPRRPDLARRLVAAHPQTGLRRHERLRNLERAFAADPGVYGRRLLILDDTATTGTTLRRLAQCLLQAGAAEITVAVVAVALPHRNS
jgi:ComF family protein